MYEEIFREYDIRGIYKKELSEKSVKAIGFALANVLKEKGCKNISVGYDARLSANDMFKWLVSGLNSQELNVFDIGLIPTPVGYFSLFYTGFDEKGIKFDANIMITGSHNPKDYNGFKITIQKESFFGSDLQKLCKQVDEIINKNIDINDDFKSKHFDIESKYVDFMIKNFSNLKDMNVSFVVDCANGATGNVVKNIINGLNLNAKILYEKPDGNFPNHHPDPSVEENLKDLKRELTQNFKIGFGFDGDGDRIAVLTQKNNIKGDELAYLFALNIKNPRVMGEVKFSQSIYEEIDKFGVTFMSKTGHSNIKKAMKEHNIDLAAEVSGHVFFKERYFGYDDGIYAMMRVLELISNKFDLDEKLAKLPKVFSTDEIKIPIDEKYKFKAVEIFKENLKNGKLNLPQVNSINEIDGIRVHFKDGWALLRASNTTPVLITRFEAKDKKLLEEIKKEFLKEINEIKFKLEIVNEK